jgi:hypothetical protein
MLFVLTSLFALPVYAGPALERSEGTWTETTFADFADGGFDAGGNIVASPDGNLTLTGQQWDLNNDGFLDIVFCNGYDGTSPNINSYIYWGSASGFSIGNKTELPTHGACSNSVADLNGDGFIDIVFSNGHDGTSYNTNSVVYWGSAIGFSSGDKTELPTHGAFDNSVADLNGDGFLDIVFCNNYDDTSGNINSVIYWGSASGFSSGDKMELPTHQAGGSSVADLNGDGFLDIVFSNNHDGTSHNTDSFIYWGSAIGFSSSNKTELPTHGAVGNSVADLNSDGFLDIVFSNIYDGTSYNTDSFIYWGSAGGFSSDNKTELPTHGAYGNSVADLNSDGFLDIVFSNEYDGTSVNINSYIYWGSAGGFSSGNKTELPTHNAISNSVADLNGDGFLDIVFSNMYDGTSYNINSYIYWGSANGFSSGNKIELPTHGAHLSTTKDLGDAYTRLPEFVYISSAYDTGAASSFGALSWVATPPIPPVDGGEQVGVQFQIRTADTQEALTEALWYGPTGTSDRYTVSGTAINPIHSGDRWAQYRVFLGTNYASTPILDSVAIDYTTYDTTPPSAVTNLSIYSIKSDSVTLNWTAPGDDGNEGTATTYDVRYSKEPITDANWDGATQCDGEPSPKPVSSSETFTVIGLSPNTVYYFAMKTADEALNLSDLSNVPSCKTTAKTGDVSGNGTVSAYDAALILQYVVGLINEFPVDLLGSPGEISPRDYILRLPDLSATAGKRVQVLITIDDVTGLLRQEPQPPMAGGLSLKYDATVLRAVGVGALNVLNGAYWQGNVDLEGEVRFAFASALTPALSQREREERVDQGEREQKGEGERMLMVEFEVLPNTEGRTSPLVLENVNLSNSLTISEINGSITVIPMKTALLPNYPNPFNPDTWIPYQLADSVPVEVRIYDGVGKLVRVLSFGVQNAGVYFTKDKAVFWDGRSNAGEKVASGVYYYTLRAGDFTATRKMVVVK